MNKPEYQQVIIKQAVNFIDVEHDDSLLDACYLEYLESIRESDCKINGLPF